MVDEIECHKLLKAIGKHPGPEWNVSIVENRTYETFGGGITITLTAKKRIYITKNQIKKFAPKLNLGSPRD